MKIKCSGIKFRGYQNQFFDSKSLSFNYKEGFRLLKRKSCVCRHCTSLLSYIKNEGDEMLDCNYWFKTFNHDPIQNGETYELKVESWGCDDDYYGNSIAYPEEVAMVLVK